VRGAVDLGKLLQRVVDLEGASAVVYRDRVVVERCGGARHQRSNRPSLARSIRTCRIATDASARSARDPPLCAGLTIS
jgi:hypothetical protein